MLDPDRSGGGTLETLDYWDNFLPGQVNRSSQSLEEFIEQVKTHPAKTTACIDLQPKKGSKYRNSDVCSDDRDKDLQPFPQKNHDNKNISFEPFIKVNVPREERYLFHG